VVLFEKGDRFAPGLAFGTRCEHHLLNVPAGSISAFPDRPSHFLDWLRTHAPDAQPGTFAPRRADGDSLDRRDGGSSVTWRLAGMSTAIASRLSSMTCFKQHAAPGNSSWSPGGSSI